MLRGQHTHLGRDDAGREHHLDAATATIHVVASDGSRAHRFDVDARPERRDDALGAYLGHVAATTGWEDQRVLRTSNVFAGVGE
jgi:hypothetical protein